MSARFSRTLRALDSDRSVALRTSMLLGALLLAAWSGWMGWAHVPVYEAASARLEVEAAAHPVQAPASGRVVTAAMLLGRVVAQGDVLFELDVEAQRLELAVARARLTAIGPELAAAREERGARAQAVTDHGQGAAATLTEARARHEEARAAKDLAEQELRRARELHAGGAISDAELARATAAVAQHRAQSEALEAAVKRIAASDLAESSDRRARREGLARVLAELEGEELTVRATIDRLEHEIARRTVRASVAGRLADAVPLTAGSIVHEGTTLGAVVPDRRLRVVAEYPPPRRSRRLALQADHAVHRVAVADVRDALCERLEAPLAEDADRTLCDLIADPVRRRRAREALLRERLDAAKVADGWLLGVAAGWSFWAEIRAARLVSKTALLLIAHAIELLLTIGAWYILGRRALDAQIDSSWLVAWALCLISTLPFGVLTVFLQGRIALGVGILLKRRLLVGALRIDEQVLRREGSGQLLGRALESGAVEALASSGGEFAVLGLVDIVVLACVLPSAPAGAWQALSLGLWALLAIGLALCHYRRSLRATEARRQMTDDLIAKMVGHRTRLAQQSPARWHDGEDAAVARYASLSRAADTADAWVRAMPRAWLLVGLASCAPSFLLGTSSPASVAVAVAVVLLGGVALVRLTAGLSRIGGAAIAWREVAPLFDAATCREEESCPMGFTDDGSAVEHGKLLVDASELVFAYPKRSRPAVLGASLTIRTVGGRQVDPRLPPLWATPARQRTLAPRWSRSADARPGGLARPRRDRAAIPCKPCPNGIASFQFIDGETLAADSGGYPRCARGLRWPRPRRARRDNAFRAHADGRRVGMAALAWRTKSSIFGARGAPRRKAIGARRDLCRARRRDARAVPALGAREGAVTRDRRSPLVLAHRTRHSS